MDSVDGVKEWASDSVHGVTYPYDTRNLSMLAPFLAAMQLIPRLRPRAAHEWNVLEKTRRTAPHTSGSVVYWRTKRTSKKCDRW